MTDTFEYIAKRYKVDSEAISPVQLPYNREDLALLFKELGFNRGVEVGVEKGIYSAILCGVNPNLKLYCIDPWEDYSGYKEDRDQHWFNRKYAFAKRRLKPYNCEIVKKYSMDAIRDFKPNSLDFVYIDANHSFEYVIEDITKWSKIVKVGGIVAGHDYKDTKNMHPGVTKAVDLYVKEHNKKLFLLTWGSWFFVR